MTPPTPPRSRAKPETRRQHSTAKPAAMTVAQLRELARELGVRGYSRLRKDELERELVARGRLPDSATAASAPAATTSRGAPLPASAQAPTPTATAPAAPLTEDIDRLPQSREPQLGLLPQRPGVVQAYWVLPLELTRTLPPLHLRLMRADTDRDPLIAELPVAAGRGQHYFQFAENVDPGAVYLQLGYYDSNRQFVNAIGRALAHVPSLYAARHDPNATPQNEAQFRALYLRTGGSERDGRLGWSASTSSPVAPFSAPSSAPFNR